MKRVVALLTVLLALLTACAAEEKEERAEALQRQYAGMTGCTARVEAVVARGEETVRYTLDVERSGGETRVTVLSPEELRSVSAVIGGDGAIRLEFDGMVLDAGSAAPKVSALSGVDLLLRAAAEGYVTERSTERFGDADALRLCFETELDGETLLCTAYFDDGNAPLYAELERGGEVLAYLEFTEFEFGDIINPTMAVIG